MQLKEPGHMRQELGSEHAWRGDRSWLGKDEGRIPYSSKRPRNLQYNGQPHFSVEDGEKVDGTIRPCCYRASAERRRVGSFLRCGQRLGVGWRGQGSTPLHQEQADGVTVMEWGVGGGEKGEGWD